MSKINVNNVKDKTSKYFDIDNSAIMYFDMLGYNYDEILEIINNFPISEKVIKYSKILLEYDSVVGISNILNNIIPKDEILSTKEIDQIKYINHIIRTFFTTKLSVDYGTIDEMKYLYNYLKENNILNESKLYFFEYFLKVRENKINKIFNSNERELKSILMEMNDGEIKNLRHMLGFEKKPIYLHTADLTEFRQISEDYIYELTDNEKNLDKLIEKILIKKDQAQESNYGFLFYSKISKSLSKYGEYCSYIINEESNNLLKSLNESIFSKQKNYTETKENAKENLNNLLELSKLHNKSVTKLLEDITLINEMTSLDELVVYRNNLGKDYIWLKKAISEVIKNLSQRIIDFNKDIINNNANETLSHMTYWQKLQLLCLRENDSLSLENNELPNFSLESLKILINSTKEDQIKEAQKNGFDTYDEYMLSIYENEVNEQNIIDFKQLQSIKYYKDRIKKNKF